MSKAAASTIATRRQELPIAGRAMEVRNFTRAAPGANENAPPATAEIVFSAGAAVRRYDYWRERAYNEVLVVDDSSIRMDRFKRGIPLLDTHSSWRLEAQLGVVEDPKIEAGRGTATATFSRRESVAGVVQDVQDGIIRSVSVGYVRHRVEMMPPENDGELWTYRVIDWEPMEVSLVPIPADMDSQILRSAGNQPADDQAQQLRHYPCEFVELATRNSPTAGQSAANQPTEGHRHMPKPNDDLSPAGVNNAQAQPASTTAPAPVAQRAAEPAADAAAILQRAADITDLCARHGAPQLASGLIKSNSSVDQARAAILDELVKRDAAMGGHRNVRGVETVQDEMQVRMAGIEQAILHRVAAKTQLDDNGKQYRGMSLLEMGRDFLEAHGVSTRGLDRLTLATRMLHFRAGGMHGTSDFPSLFANVASKRLRGAYEENPGTYALWARRAPNAPDFKQIQVTSLSGAPELLQTNEHGEFKYGTLSDGKETYSVITYGRIVSLTRQAIINDDLRAFDRLVTAFGFSARRLENRLVYSQLTANGNLSDGKALFHADHTNLGTGAGSALQLSALSAGRTAMRLQKGLAGEELNLSPSYLIVPAALESTAYQLTSANYVPAKAADTNEFRAGGRTSVEPIVEPILDGASSTAWYLAANSGQVDTVEYCYLDGAEGPVIESETGFEVDGVSFKCREDFAAKAIDHRGLYKGAGA
jgi:hypothetical protein